MYFFELKNIATRYTDL